MEQQGGRRFADLARPGGQRGERRAAIGRLDDVVEADHGAVSARRDSLVGEPEHDAEGTDVVVAQHRGGIVNAADERKPGETDEQFVYKTRKKALGPFKRRMWDMPDENKKPIVDELEAKFEFLMEKLAVFGTADLVRKYVPVSTSELPAYAAASEELTAAAVVDPNEGE